MSLEVTSMMPGELLGGTLRLMIRDGFFVKLSSTIQACGCAMANSM
jgi:hypothetical protein